MLRFDIAPVCSSAYRFQATMSFAIAAIYLFTPFQWVSIFLAVGGLIRGFLSPHKCFSYKLFAALTGKMGVAKMQNAGSKMFADKIAGIAGSAMFVTWLIGSPVGVIPGWAILVFAFIDLATGFCAACWAYTVYYRLKQA